jgi:hypothetical protein
VNIDPERDVVLLIVEETVEEHARRRRGRSYQAFFPVPTFRPPRTWTACGPPWDTGPARRMIAMESTRIAGRTPDVLRALEDGPAIPHCSHG